MQSARPNHVNPHAWLADVLAGLQIIRSCR
jgi:hypothetical protein